MLLLSIGFTIFTGQIDGMKIHYGYESLKFDNPVVTIGIFDGVHAGHRYLLERLCLRAKEMKGTSVAITFDPHPRLILGGIDKKPFLLTTLDEKIELIEKTGLDNLVIIGFNSSFSKIDAGRFIEKILVRKIGVKHLITGHDHHFGKHGEGSYDLIQKNAARYGFTAEKIEEIKTTEGTVSSSLVRAALLDGNLHLAKRWLGYDYFINGKIIRGLQVGRHLGFPTANIKPDDRFKLIPANGVYAVKVSIEGKTMPGILSTGTNPTVNRDETKKSIEVHIFDFEGDIYGKKIRVEFLHRLREERKFDTLLQLKEQIKLDLQDAKDIFSLGKD